MPGPCESLVNAGEGVGVGDNAGGGTGHGALDSRGAWRVFGRKA